MEMRRFLLLLVVAYVTLEARCENGHVGDDLHVIPETDHEGGFLANAEEDILESEHGEHRLTRRGIHDSILETVVKAADAEVREIAPVDEIVGVVQGVAGNVNSQLPSGVKGTIGDVLATIVPPNRNKKRDRPKGSLRSRSSDPRRESIAKARRATTTPAPVSQTPPSDGVVRGSRNKKVSRPQ